MWGGARTATALSLVVASCTGSGTSTSTSTSTNEGGAGNGQAVSPHAPDFVLGDGQTYQKNPDVKLAREYWLVIAAEGGTYFMVPRPDGDARIAEECRTKGSLALFFQGLSLCESASSEAAVKRVNALTRSEAMQTSTFLHQKLRFQANDATDLAPPRVEPFALTSDLLDVCKTFPADRDGALRAVCDEELARAMSSAGAAERAHQLSLAECQTLAARLNDLYGIR
jgi:hypothetical protein